MGGNAVTPSFYGTRKGEKFYDGGAFSNTMLREGVVIHVHYPNDSKSESKKFLEYDVQLQHRANGTGTTKTAYNCTVLNPFGGLADRSYYTLRPGPVNDSGVGTGSKVFVMFINGETSRGVIVGGKRDPEDPGYVLEKRKKGDLEGQGRHLFGIFNGLSWTIDDDGQLTVRYNGKTEIDNKRNTDIKDNQVGTFLSFTKNGGFIVADKDAKNALSVDHENGKVLIARDKGFEIGKASDKMLLGSSFRDAQKQLHDDLKQGLTQAATALTTAGVSVVGPFMSANCGAQLIQAATALLQAVQSITAFETKASAKTSFLSDKDKLGG